MTTINHECYVSLEVAKLLKEAGFDWEVYTYYTHIIIEDLNMDATTGLMFGGKHNYNSSDDYSAPSLEVAQKWLREVKGQYVLANPIKDKWFYALLRPNFGHYYRNQQFDTYESALEAGIQKCLTLILEKDGKDL